MSVGSPHASRHASTPTDKGTSERGILHPLCVRLGTWIGVNRPHSIDGSQRRPHERWYGIRLACRVNQSFTHACDAFQVTSSRSDELQHLSVRSLSPSLSTCTIELLVLPPSKLFSNVPGNPTSRCETGSPCCPAPTTSDTCTHNRRKCKDKSGRHVEWNEAMKRGRSRRTRWRVDASQGKKLEAPDASIEKRNGENGMETTQARTRQAR